MFRLTTCLTCVLAFPALASAQGIVIAGYPATAYYSPTPVVTAYYAPAPTAYYAPAPVVTAYASPSVSYYSTPAVVTYRYPLLRPRTTVVRAYPGAVVAVPTAPVVASYYAAPGYVP